MAIGWLFFCMSQHSVAEARNKLTELIARAEKGEEIVITRHGKPVVKISALATKPAPRVPTQADWDWLAERRKGRKIGDGSVDAGTLVSQMRDEDWR
jgi:antitoxin (DNA-binding transcriptional repressor) of toxin-antitoxin stability system